MDLEGRDQGSTQHVTGEYRGKYQSGNRYAERYWYSSRSAPTYWRLVPRIQNKTTKLFCLQDKHCLAISRYDHY
jgi:hypothetical protein